MKRLVTSLILTASITLGSFKPTAFACNAAMGQCQGMRNAAPKQDPKLNPQANAGKKKKRGNKFGNWIKSQAQGLGQKAASAAGQAAVEKVSSKFNKE